MDDEAVLYLVDLLDDPVELAGAEANSAAIQRRVGATGDDAAAVLEELHPVALPPDARIVLEVRRPVALTARVVPEADRHRRHRFGDHQLSELAGHRIAGRVEGRRRHAEAATGDGTCPHRQQRVALHDSGAHVGSTAAVHQQDVVAEDSIDPHRRLRREGRPGGADLAQS